MAEESSNPNRVSYAFDDDAKHLVLTSCFEGLGKLLVFDVKPNPYPVLPKIQSPFDDACDDDIMLSISLQSSHIRIYTHKSKDQFNREYKANETHLWKTQETVLDERDNIRF
jgi:hypothetical protein